FYSSNGFTSRFSAIIRAMRSFLLAVLLVSISAFAQDIAKVAPDAVKVEFEDARVRVLRLHLAPNQAVPMHDLRARVEMCLTPNNFSFIRGDGTSGMTTRQFGLISWREPAKQSLKNGPAELENIIIEVK